MSTRRISHDGHRHFTLLSETDEAQQNVAHAANLLMALQKYHAQVTVGDWLHAGCMLFMKDPAIMSMNGKVILCRTKTMPPHERLHKLRQPYGTGLERQFCQAACAAAMAGAAALLPEVRDMNARMRACTRCGWSCCTQCEQSSSTCSSRSGTYFSVPCMCTESRGRSGTSSATALESTSAGMQYAGEANKLRFVHMLAIAVPCIAWCQGSLHTLTSCGPRAESLAA